MGRKKIQITRIMDERNRQVSPMEKGGWMSGGVDRRRSIGGGGETPYCGPGREDGRCAD